ncbi:4348_t:CDS:2, partial [Funneliformis caledonium]
TLIHLPYSDLSILEVAAQILNVDTYQDTANTFVFPLISSNFLAIYAEVGNFVNLLKLVLSKIIRKNLINELIATLE